MTDQPMTLERFERFIKPLINYFHLMNADQFDDVRALGVAMLDAAGIDAGDADYWRVTDGRYRGMFEPGRVNERESEGWRQDQRRAIYGPWAFHKAQPTESVVHWPRAQAAGARVEDYSDEMEPFVTTAELIARDKALATQEGQ